MPDVTVAPGRLATQIGDLRARYPEVPAGLVADLLRSVLAATGATRQSLAVMEEVQQMARTIAAAKTDLANLRADDIRDAHIPSATDELDAIVRHTAAATDAILEACEALDAVADGLDASVSEQVQAATTKIYEACSFQDITGQRIGKIVATLKTIEQKVAAMMQALPPRPEGEAGSARGEVNAASVDDPASLLNGPQLPEAALEQAEIDRLLTGLG